MKSTVGFGRNFYNVDDQKKIEEHVSNALRFQLVDQYGWKDRKAQDYIDKYLEMSTSREFVRSICGEYNLYGKKILELGSGLGNVLVQMGLSGLNAVGIEPSDEFVDIIARRLEQYKLNSSSLLKGFGENLAP